MVKKKLYTCPLLFSLMAYAHLCHGTQGEAIDHDHTSLERDASAPSDGDEQVAPALTHEFLHEAAEEDDFLPEHREKSKTEKLVHAVLVKALSLYFACVTSVNYLKLRTIFYYNVCKKYTFFT